MQEYKIPYGRSELSFRLPDNLQPDWLAPPTVSPSPDPEAAIREALANPCDGISLSQYRGAKSATIAINDKTRPVPHQYLLPPLLNALEEIGIPPKVISLICATGAHPPMAASEFSRVVPESILARYPMSCHNCDLESNLEYLGRTARGTPIWINKTFMAAELRIVVGNIEPHQFQGFSGGVKSAAIGLAGRATIEHNHAMMTDPFARLGEFERNPARQDVEEIGRLIGVHFALNAILTEKGQIHSVIAGSPDQVLQAGIPASLAVCQVTVDQPYDLVIASPGGHPKDINLYQAQKGFAHAALITRDRGIVILAAACPEGSGSKRFEAWAEQAKSIDELIQRFKNEHFQIGPHKAYQFARDATRVNLLLVSNLDPALVRRWLLSPAQDINAALSAALPLLSNQARIGIMPRANATIPGLLAGL